MLWFHPLLQFSATVLSFYVLFLGITRFRQSHLKHGVRFNWKRHVFWGQAVLIVWLLGLIGGLVMVFRLRSAILITGPHALFGLVLGLLAVFGLISGLYMNRVKKKRNFLPIVHGLGNTLAVALAIIQVWTGWQVINFLILGN